MTLLNKIRNKWELIGIQLEINQAEIVHAKVKMGLQNDTQRLAHILQLWIDKHSCEPSWKKIISIVKEPPIDDKEIVEEIHQFLTRLNIQHEYISQGKGCGIVTVLRCNLYWTIRLSHFKSAPSILAIPKLCESEKHLY